MAKFYFLMSSDLCQYRTLSETVNSSIFDETTLTADRLSQGPYLNTTGKDAYILYIHASSVIRLASPQC
jgi:hypothetical protein